MRRETRDVPTVVVSNEEWAAHLTTLAVLRNRLQVVESERAALRDTIDTIVEMVCKMQVTEMASKMKVPSAAAPLGSPDSDARP